MTQMKPIGGVEQLTNSVHQQFPWSWSRDGRLLAYTEWNDPGQYDIWLLPVEGQSREPIPFVTTDANESQPSFSPDGRWIAYVAEESEKNYEIFLQAIQPDGQKSEKFYKVSRAGGLEPRWSPDGAELFFRSVDGSHLLGVKLDRESFEPGPEGIVLENVHFPTSDTYAEFGFYDVADKQKFIVLLEESGPERAKMIVVVNWLEELEQKMSAGK
jgi:dipeptidyl aminopeptidase/acylaminoacyl peptidase